jgi:hypothetical protein
VVYHDLDAAEKEWGANHAKRKPDGRAMKEVELIADIERILPEFALACRGPDAPVAVMHQDAFAADYQDEEYRLLGMAIKFAGICGKEIQIIGTNRQTVDQRQTMQ